MAVRSTVLSYYALVKSVLNRMVTSHPKLKQGLSQPSHNKAPARSGVHMTMHKCSASTPHCTWHHVTVSAQQVQSSSLAQTVRSKLHSATPFVKLAGFKGFMT